MLTAGIALDKWKLPYFKKALTDAGYKSKLGDVGDKKLEKDMSFLMVDFETGGANDLALVVKAVNDKCARIKGMH